MSIKKFCKVEFDGVLVTFGVFLKPRAQQKKSRIENKLFFVNYLFEKLLNSLIDIPKKIMPKSTKLFLKNHFSLNINFLQSNYLLKAHYLPHIMQTYYKISAHDPHDGSKNLRILIWSLFSNLEKEKKCVDLEFGKSQWVDFKWRVDVVVHYSLRLLEDFSRSFCYGKFFQCGLSLINKRIWVLSVPLLERNFFEKMIHFWQNHDFLGWNCIIE